MTLFRGKYNINPSSSTSLWTVYTTDTTNYVTSSKTSSSENYYQLLTTGASKQTNKLNIYDLAGNVHEFTLEYSNLSDAPCIHRGVSFMDSGKTYPVFYHGQNKISDIFLHIRFPCNTLLKI